MPPDLTLPTTRPPAPLAQATGEVVLIVDDVPGNLAVLHDALDEAGYTVLVATDGPSAITSGSGLPSATRSWAWRRTQSVSGTGAKGPSLPK